MTDAKEQTYYFESEHFRRPIRAVKWMGVIGIILITLSSPMFVLASTKWSQDHPLDDQVKVEANQTACSYLKQFYLTDNVIIWVCNRGGDIVLDIRLFLNQTATIHGIPLNMRQWRTLQRISPTVNRAIEKASEPRGGA